MSLGCGCGCRGLWLRTIGWLLLLMKEERVVWRLCNGVEARANVGVNAPLFCIPRTPFPGNTKPNCRTNPPQPKQPKHAPKPAENERKNSASKQRAMS